jgi:2-polyprenyl-3-methyl-5-hydroxy-6-metoxy-1,4-benzoquinol methylase
MTLCCKCCNSEDISKLAYVPDSTGIERQLFLCNNCAGVFAEFGGGGAESDLQQQLTLHEALWLRTPIEEMRFLSSEMLRTVDLFRPILGQPGSEDVICELGSGRGNLTAALAQRGYSVRSCDPSDALNQMAKASYGLTDRQICCSEAEPFLRELKNENLTIRAIILWHVIEHVENPVGLIKLCVDAIVTDGVILLQAPMPAPPYIYPEHRFFVTRSWVHRVGQMCGLKPFFCDISPLEQFIAFGWCRPEIGLALDGFSKPVEPIDPVGGWIADLTMALLKQQSIKKSH